MNKKISIIFLLLILGISNVFAVSQDYINGYIAGYSDGKLGFTSKYTRDDDSAPISVPSSFTIKFFVDEFDDYTEECYVSLKDMQPGISNNSLISNSDIKWNLIVSPWEFSFSIYEYGYSRLMGNYNYPDKYTISIKTEDGTILKADAENSDDRISVTSDYDYYGLLNEFKKSKTIKILISEISDYYPTSYNLGTLNCEGFSALYDQMIDSYNNYN